MKKKEIVIVNQFFPPDFAPTGQLLKELPGQLSKKNIYIEVLTCQPSYATKLKKTNN